MCKSLFVLHLQKKMSLFLCKMTRTVNMVYLPNSYSIWDNNPGIATP